MKATAAIRPTFAVLALAVAGSPARAGIKYWDNQAYKAYDADDYAPGAWTENGFMLTGDSEWRAAGSAASIESGTNYTLQALVSGDWSA